MLNVHFVNRGYGTDDGIKNVKVNEIAVCSITQRPVAVIDSPYFPGDTLRAEYVNNEWLCDLD